MIELSIEELLLSIVSICLFLAEFLALIGHFRERNGGGFVSKRVVRCSLCGSAYEGQGRYPDCKTCERPNRRGSSKRLG